ncbi:DUF4377 domain-containing protein [Burkholderia multivorans]|uniref:DUF4377 domain-containing protein n=1 Tax=Burkholderia multivorans (strain ATCC 17616 / 249) TaxID=395019 RepID=A0A0H3KV21_BURM1|nr:DUF4377 domain-containing protein [Burkholderia multivorans]ABX17844.1 conserved hypothetical protein [Burkholderia multivorans ATCC 17616]PRF63698.1 DUF4377 domain-containing protein [Burkholderia multivorans]BAG46198.1 conserved hypothetical protein [Burkholderia multivorans ATCC 17616]
MIRHSRLLFGAIALAAGALLTGCQTGAATTAAATTAAAARADEDRPVTKTVYVAPQTVRCTGVAPMDCLQVRSDPNAPWTLWYAGIEGFAYQPGYTYTLQIDEYRVAQPPADRSSIRWVLKRVIERRPVN